MRKKKKKRDRECKGATEGTTIVRREFSAHFSITAERNQRPAVYISCGESLPFALKCYIVFFPSGSSGSSGVSVFLCYRIKSPDYSFHEHDGVYSERGCRGRGKSGNKTINIRPLCLSTELRPCKTQNPCTCTSFQTIIVYIYCVLVRWGSGDGAHKDFFEAGLFRSLFSHPHHTLLHPGSLHFNTPLKPQITKIFGNTNALLEELFLSRQKLALAGLGCQC